MDLSQFIVHYPERSDGHYVDIMSQMQEFRELLFSPEGEDVSTMSNVDDPFFYNYQMLIGRWMAPWTNNRSILIRWDPGSGKTRAGLIFTLIWRQNSSHKKTLIISNTDIVLRAIDNEVIKYNNYDIELEKGIYKTGRRGHGKTIRSSRYVIKQGFDRYNITSFMNKLHQRHEQEVVAGSNQTFEEFVRKRYANYTLVIDEAHGMRATDGPKQQYENLIDLIDALRGVCPMMFMTATPIVNTVADLFSLIGMMHPPDVRRDIEAKAQEWRNSSGAESTAIIDHILNTYAMGLVSDRTSAGVVPAEDYLPGPYNFNENGRVVFSINRNLETDEPVEIPENLFPVFMSQYQTEYTAIQEAGENSISEIRTMENIESLFSKKNTGVIGNIRLIYDFAPPLIQGEGYLKTEVLVEVEESTGRYLPTARSIIRYADGTEENVFKIEWVQATQAETEAWNRALMAYYRMHNIDPQNPEYKLFTYGTLVLPSKTKGLGKYSAKYSMLIWMLEYHPLLANKTGYVHTLWVEMGTKLIAASLYANGWVQYMGHEAVAEPLYRENPDGSRTLIRRFGIIDGSAKNTKATQVSRIMEAANNPLNRDGSILGPVLGSRKSGISISLTNARYTAELSSEFNKASSIQSKGRVFRANSITWLRGPEWRILTAVMIALPLIPSSADPEVNEELQEATDQYMDDLALGYINNETYASLVRQEDNVPYNINPYTIEMYMYRLAEIKDRVSRYAMDKLHQISIESIIGLRTDRPSNTLNHALLYGDIRKDVIKSNILGHMPHRWEYRLNSDDMYTMRASAELLSHYAMAQSRYGMIRPLQSYGDMMTIARSTQSLAYERSFFLTEGSKLYSSRAIAMAIDLLRHAPEEKVAFFYHISNPLVQDLKAILLEMALVFPEALLRQEGIDVLSTRALINAKRSLILELYTRFWDVFGEGRIIHILWYSIRDNSYLMKVGIMATPSLKTRAIGYTGDGTQEEWRYMESMDREAIYLSPMAQDILAAEEAVIANAESYGYNYYIHFSVFDGIIRFRETRTDDKRKSKAVILGLNTIADLDILGQMFEMTMAEFTNLYGQDIDALRRVIFYRAQELGILIIR